MAVMAEAPNDRLEETIALLDRLVSFDTESSKSNLPIVRFIEEYLERRGIDFVTVPNAEGDKAAVFATIGPKVDGGVVLSGHTDVVPVAGQSWTSDPFAMRRAGSRLYGRGTVDMKGFDAVALSMVDEFRHAPLKKPVHILLSYDEETTCRGPLDTIARFGKDLPVPAAVIVGEPTNMHVADAHKAIATYYTTVHGHEAHSSKPNLGANAIEAAARLVCELYAFAAGQAESGSKDPRFDPPYSTLSVGTIHGGTARNILARQCAFHWEFRALPGLPQDLALRHLEDFIAARLLPDFTRHAPDARVETITEVEVPGLSAAPGSVAETLALRLTRANRTVAVPFATEAGRFDSAGISTVVCGPGSIAQAHQPDEFIEIDELSACIGFMRGLIRELS